MRIWKRVCALALAALLVLPAAASAQSYTDLPVFHWAYDDMTQAADLGIIQGVGDGRIDPSKAGFVTFDPVNNAYLAIGARIGTAFSDGKVMR